MTPTFRSNPTLLVSNPLIFLLFNAHPAYSFDGTLFSETYDLVAEASCLPGMSPWASSQAISVVDCCQKCSNIQECSALAFSHIQDMCHVFSDVTFQQPISGCGGVPGPWALWNKRQDENTTLLSSTAACDNGGQLQADGTCLCFGGFVGAHCERLMRDCYEALQSGHYPDLGNGDLSLNAKPSLSPHSISVQCKEDGGTVLLRQNYRNNVALNYTWDDYVNGFYTPVIKGAFWMGLQNLYHFTNSDTYQLFVYVAMWNNSIYGWRYESFVITNDVDYTASLGTFRSNDPIGAEMMGSMHGARFTTKDHYYDNTTNRDCALSKGGGWWYNGCSMNYNFVGELAEEENFLIGEEFVQYGTFQAWLYFQNHLHFEITLRLHYHLHLKSL